MQIQVDPLPPSTLLNKSKLQQPSEQEKTLKLLMESYQFRKQRSSWLTGTDSTETIISACNLSGDHQVFASLLANKLNMTARGFTRLLKVARTIADLELTDDVRKVHLEEALSFRKI